MTQKIVAKCEPTAALQESREWIHVVNIWKKKELIYMIFLFCYLLHDVVAVLLAVEVSHGEHYCHVSCVHMGAGLGWGMVPPFDSKPKERFLQQDLRIDVSLGVWKQQSTVKTGPSKQEQLLSILVPTTVIWKSPLSLFLGQAGLLTPPSTEPI